MRRKLLTLLVLILVGIGIVFSADALASTNVPQPLSTHSGHIVYLTSSKTPTSPDNLIAPEHMQTAIGAQIASTWEQVQTIDSAEPIDALIIDASARDMVERDWLDDAYRRGVVVAAFNLYAPDLADLVADPCVAADGFASDPYPGDFFVVSYRVIVGDADDVARVEQATEESCGQGTAQGVQGQVRVAGGRVTNELESDENFTVFELVLNDMIESVNEVERGPEE
jgi:hypothetical protein